MTDSSSPAKFHTVAEAASQLAVMLSNYNHGRYLPAALDSIAAQTVRPAAAWIYEDGSTDDSRNILAAYAARYPFIRPTYLEKNRGFFANQKEFLKNVNVAYLYFGAADDVIHPELFARSLAMLTAYPNAGLCSAMTMLMGPDGQDLGPMMTVRPSRRPIYLTPAKVSRQLMADQPWFVGNTTVYRREALLDAGGFDVEMQSVTDSFASQVIALQRGACFLPEHLGYWRRLADGYSSSINANPKAVLSVGARGKSLMTQSHAGLFPVGYAERWHKRWISSAIAVAVRTTPDRAAEAALQLMAPAAPPDRAILLLARKLPWGQNVIILALALVRLRWFDLPRILRRLVMSFVLPASRNRL